MKPRILLCGLFSILLAGCESQTRLQTDLPTETATETSRLQVLQTVTTSGTLVAIALPQPAQVWAALPAPPSPVQSADKVAIVSGGSLREFSRSSYVLPVSPVATANVSVLSTFVSAPISTDRSGNADVLLVLDGKQATRYHATVTTR